MSKRSSDSSSESNEYRDPKKQKKEDASSEGGDRSSVASGASVCSVRYADARQLPVVHWNGGRTCEWPPKNKTSEEIEELRSRFKTCYLCGKSGCSACVNDAIGIDWPEHPGLCGGAICEPCYETHVWKSIGNDESEDKDWSKIPGGKYGPYARWKEGIDYAIVEGCFVEIDDDPYGRRGRGDSFDSEGEEDEEDEEDDANGKDKEEEEKETNDSGSKSRTTADSQPPFPGTKKIEIANVTVGVRRCGKCRGMAFCALGELSQAEVLQREALGLLRCMDCAQNRN